MVLFSKSKFDGDILMEILKVVMCIIIGFTVSGVWFGITFGCNILLRKYQESWIFHLCPALASIPILIIVAQFISFLPVQDDIAILIKYSGIAILTAIISAIIICNIKQRKYKSGIKLLWWGIDGVLMEIPQRLMMQSIIYGILKYWEMPHIVFWTVTGTAVVWCASIVMQNLIVRQPLNKELIYEIAASLVFSIGIGYVYQQSGVIVLTMIGHFIERVISNALLRKNNLS